jgi:tetratricopeptide (TPR) repeat protein
VILRNLSNVCYALGDYPQAIDYAQARLLNAQQLGDRRSEEQSLGSLGVAYDAVGDYAQAIEYYEQRLSVARAIPDPRVEKQALGSLRAACYALGDYAKVIEYHEQGLGMGNREEYPFILKTLEQ